MKSLTKEQVSEHDITRIIRASLGEDVRIGKIEELHERYFSTAYAIELKEREHDAVLKIAPPDHVRLLTYESDVIHAEVAVYQMLHMSAKLT